MVFCRRPPHVAMSPRCFVNTEALYLKEPSINTAAVNAGDYRLYVGPPSWGSPISISRVWLTAGLQRHPALECVNVGSLADGKHRHVGGNNIVLVLTLPREFQQG